MAFWKKRKYQSEDDQFDFDYMFSEKTGPMNPKEDYGFQEDKSILFGGSEKYDEISGDSDFWFSDSSKDPFGFESEGPFRVRKKKKRTGMQILVLTLLLMLLFTVVILTFVFKVPHTKECQKLIEGFEKSCQTSNLPNIQLCIDPSMTYLIRVPLERDDRLTHTAKNNILAQVMKNLDTTGTMTEEDIDYLLDHLEYLELKVDAVSLPRLKRKVSCTAVVGVKNEKMTFGIIKSGKNVYISEISVSSD